jgi:hypothetical protein
MKTAAGRKVKEGNVDAVKDTTGGPLYVADLT